MPAIQRDSLMTLEAYAKARKEFRARVLEHKKARTVHLGDHVTLIFEDELTLRYQIQEMLRIEKAFEEDAIQDELEAYNPMVPDGSNFKATMLIEYEDAEERRAALMKLKGIEDRVWIAVAGLCEGICHRRRGSAARKRSEDLRRPLPALRAVPRDGAAMKRGAGLAIGIDHPAYQAEIPAVGAATRDSLAADLA